jgi:hypothetical protein
MDASLRKWNEYGGYPSERRMCASGKMDTAALGLRVSGDRAADTSATRRTASPSSASELEANTQRGLERVKGIIVAIDDLVQVAIPRIESQRDLVGNEVLRADTGVEGEAVIITDPHWTDPVHRPGNRSIEICACIAEASEHIRHERTAWVEVIDRIDIERREIQVDRARLRCPKCQ